MKFLFLFLLPCLVFGGELPKPDATLQIPMRDGTRLAADLYYPPAASKPLPCILMRSPSGRQSPYALMFLPLLEQGYAVVIQETRSSKDKKGKTLPYLSDGWGDQQDGYDTVKYLTNSPYTNGKIGTVGPSAMGITQLLMAPTNPPGLTAQYVSFATSDLFHHCLFEGGELCKDQVESWLTLYAWDPEVYRQVYTQNKYNSYWEHFNVLSQAPKVKTPILHIGGWYDLFLKGALEGYEVLQKEGGEGARGAQKLVVGPWSHLWPHVTTLGEFEYPPEAHAPPYDFSPASWFAKHLKEESTSDFPNVLYYVMGPFDGSSSSGNVWKTASQWPIPSQQTALYLQEAALSYEPSNVESSRSFIYDPENPVPTTGGRNLFLPSGPFDQREIEAREDVLVFTTELLEKDIEITGALKAILFIDTDQEDTSFSVRLTDVYPDGKSLLIADGINRVSESSNRNEIHIDLSSTSIVFAKGHKIRVAVASSNYPKYEKNLNSVKRIFESPAPSIAKNTVLSGPKTPSRIILPVISTNE